jgi:hypothetical protein
LYLHLDNRSQFVIEVGGKSRELLLKQEPPSVDPGTFFGHNKIARFLTSQPALENLQFAFFWAHATNPDGGSGIRGKPPKVSPV